MLTERGIEIVMSNAWSTVPHQHPAIRSCAGCRTSEEDAPAYWCDGKATGRVYRDSDGDAGVVNGIRHFVAVEDLELSCGCTLSADEEQAVTDALCERYAEDDDLAEMDEADARREAGF